MASRLNENLCNHDDELRSQVMERMKFIEEMEETQVVIVGAGPAGLSLGLALSNLRIHSVILEKDVEVLEDPRGVALTGDTNRILWNLGIGDAMPIIGHEVQQILFHKSSFRNPPFFTLHVSPDVLKQTVPTVIFQFQPELELALRKEISTSEFCELRTGCTVNGRHGDKSFEVVTYSDGNVEQHIKCQWLVGADGKKGVVRKHFLEERAGIKQVDGKYRYTGTWVAANLRINLPTEETHPKFPLWKNGYTPEQVFDLFWPEHWHFCGPPGKPTATGQFGPRSRRLWRHEFRQENWNDSMDAEELLWEHLTPMITRTADKHGHKFSAEPIEYPRDCIEILRCRPFTFCHKVVNKWFHDRTILIGDAAHVFPPFGGQGIACGVRDAQQLAWRLACLLNAPQISKDAFKDTAYRLLTSWAAERRKSIDDAANFTRMNGKLCNEPPPFWFWVIKFIQAVIASIPFVPNLPDPQALTEESGFTSVDGGFFLKEHGGGVRLEQIYIGSPTQPSFLSDELLKRTSTIFSLLVITDDEKSTICAEAQAVIRLAGLHSNTLSEKSIICFSPESLATKSTNQSKIYRPTPKSRVPEHIINKQGGYDPKNYLSRINKAAKYVVVRPDFYVFAVASNASDLKECLSLLKRRLEIRSDK